MKNSVLCPNAFVSLSKTPIEANLKSKKNMKKTSQSFKRDNKRKNRKAIKKFVIASKKSPRTANNIEEKKRFDSSFLDLFTKYIFSLKDYFNVGFQLPKTLTISNEMKKTQEGLWAEIIDCIFNSYLKGQSLCYFSRSEKEEYPKVFHSIHNRSRFRKKQKKAETSLKELETPKENTEKNLFQIWMEKDLSEEEMESFTDCSSLDSEDFEISKQ